MATEAVSAPEARLEALVDTASFRPLPHSPVSGRKARRPTS